MIHLVIGGARSGKSGYAEQLAIDSLKEVIYIATATAGDGEMQDRIEHHQASRPKAWGLIEEPYHLTHTLQQLESDRVILIDCLTLWLSNWLCREDMPAWQKEKSAFLEVLKNTKQDVVIVSNEVGSGIIPMGELSRLFVDEAGWLNQSVAKVAENVTLVVAGCPVKLK